MRSIVEGMVGGGRRLRVALSMRGPGMELRVGRSLGRGSSIYRHVAVSSALWGSNRFSSKGTENVKEDFEFFSRNLSCAGLAA